MRLLCTSFIDLATTDVVTGHKNWQMAWAAIYVTQQNFLGTLPLFENRAAWTRWWTMLENMNDPIKRNTRESKPRKWFAWLSGRKAGERCKRARGVRARSHGDGRSKSFLGPLRTRGAIYGCEWVVSTVEGELRYGAKWAQPWRPADFESSLALAVLRFAWNANYRKLRAASAKFYYKNESRFFWEIHGKACWKEVK